MGKELNFHSYPFSGEPPEGWKLSSLEIIAYSIRPGFASGKHNKEYHISGL
jgi:hypothetical protein